MINYLKNKWGIENSLQFTIIMLVFAVTGSAAAYLSKPLIVLLGLENLSKIVYWPLRLLLVFPIYQILLVFFGYIFGIVSSIIIGKKDKFIYSFFLKMSKVFTKSLIKILTFGFYK